MKMDPFIEAEEAAGHSVNHCCELFEVSRAAYYERRRNIPSQQGGHRRRADREDHRQSTTSPRAPMARPGCTRSCASGGWRAGGAGCAGSCAGPASRDGARSAGAGPPWPTRPPRRPGT